MEILPIACTLTRAELERDAHCLMPGLLERAPTVTPLENGMRLEFAPTDGMLRDIIDVIERERRCCRFLQFVLMIPPGGGRYQLEITGPEGTSEFLAEVASIGAQ
jgi:hypothetical protein